MATRLVSSVAAGRDRAMVTAAVLAVWLVIVTGFAMDLARRARTGELHFPLVVHLHVVVYVAWLLLLVVQVWLVRTRRVAVHGRLGIVGVALLPAMLVLGPATAIVTAANPYMPDRWIAWVAVELTNVTGSAALVAAGLLWRRHASAHKRLMVMATIAMTEPGFGRIWEAPLAAWWGEGYVAFYFSSYVGTLLLVLAVGVYEVTAHRRLHPAYVAATGWILLNQLLATWLFYHPAWLALVKAMTGHAR